MDSRIEQRMEEIEDYFERLSEVRANSQGIPREESEENLVRKIVSATIDIASRIIALEGGGRPENYADYFPELEDRGIIDLDLSENLEDMARFRNFIVHQYHRIEQDQIEDIIENDLDDVRQFMEEVEEFYSDEGN